MFHQQSLRLVLPSGKAALAAAQNASGTSQQEAGVHL